MVFVRKMVMFLKVKVYWLVSFMEGLCFVCVVLISWIMFVNVFFLVDVLVIILNVVFIFSMLL